MSSVSFLPSPSLSTAIPTFTPSGGSGKRPASMTLLFGSLVVFSSLFAAFLLLCFFWQYRRAQRRGLVLEYDETIGTYRGVPKMWEVWTQGEPSGSQRDWESVRPLSVDPESALRVNPEPTASPTSHPHRSLRCAFRRPAPPPEAPPRRDSPDAPMSSLRTTFIIAMPCADPPNRRQSVLSQGPSVNGDWGQREYAIGIYHAPFREESSVSP
ncbi:hypothetical protein BJY52DRAFT_1246484 [Lactarius psammicola]|nr:hypothetical protein BJY52DRAFT_1246484 [Lactarius psammicola]